MEESSKQSTEIWNVTVIGRKRKKKETEEQSQKSLEISPSYAKLLQSCPILATLWSTAFQAPLFTGILQASILELLAMPSCRRASPPGSWIHISEVSCFGRLALYH